MTDSWRSVQATGLGDLDRGGLVHAGLLGDVGAAVGGLGAGDADGARKAMMAHLSFVHTTMKRFDEDQARHARITRLPGDHNEHSREKNA